MTDEHLVTGLTAWLQDSEVAPPDARMSASRVMAGISGTRQLGRWWPPAALVRRIRPVPALGAGAVTPPSSPRTTKEILSMLTATRIVGLAMVLTLIATGLLIGRGLVPDPVEQLPAITSPSPSVERVTEPTPDEVDASVVTATDADSVLAATKVLYGFEDGAVPYSLAEGPAKTYLYVDRSTDTAYEIERDGYRRTLVEPGKEAPDGEVFEAARSVARGGWFIDILEADGALWQWHELFEYPPHPAYDWGAGADGATRIAMAPPAVPAATVTKGKFEYDTYVIDAASGDVVEYHYLSEGKPSRAGVRIPRAGRAEARAIYADPVVYVLTADGVERYEDGELDPTFALQVPAGSTSDYRAVDGIGSNGTGQLWLYDQASEQLHVYDKRTGEFQRSWAPEPDAPSMAGTSGLVLAGDGTGSVETVAWITPGGLMVSAVRDPSLVSVDAPASAVQAGSFSSSARGAGERALDWSDGNVRLQADGLRLRVNDQVFKAAGDVDVSADAYQNTADLELEWRESGRQQRLNMQLVTEDDHWWIREIWTYDGAKDGDWVFFEDLAPLTRTPIGEAMEGDLRIENTNAERPRFQKDGSATLSIDGMLLTAFQPGERPAPLEGCERPAEELHVRYSEEIADEFGQDQGWTVVAEDEAWWKAMYEMTPAEAEAELQEMGLCYRFYYRWPGGDEYRCSAPPRGEIEAITTMGDYVANDPRPVIRVDVVDRKAVDRPAPPPYGTDCEPLEGPSN